MISDIVSILMKGTYKYTSFNGLDYSAVVCLPKGWFPLGVNRWRNVKNSLFLYLETTYLETSLTLRLRFTPNGKKPNSSST